MSRSAFKGKGTHETAFVNREQQLERLERAVVRLADDDSHFALFELIGLGGVGKTRLLDQVRSELRLEKSQILWVNLEAEAASGAVGPLRSLREQVPYDCLLFDAALVRYWTAMGQPVAMPAGSRSGVVSKSLEVGSSAAGFPVPVTFAVEMYRKASRRVTKRRRYAAAEFEAIDELRNRPADLRVRLPHYLGLDIERRLADAGDRLVVFYDGYERQSRATLSSRSPWLREFIGTLERGLHLVSTREPLDWDVADWSSVTETIGIAPLSDSAARSLIAARLGAIDEDIEQRVLEVSGRVPFFIETLVELYGALSGENERIRPEDLPSSPDDAVQHLLDHLDPTVRDSVVALAAIHVFDEQVMFDVVRRLNLPVSVLALDELQSSLFLDRTSRHVTRMQDLLTEYVRRSPVHGPYARRALAAATASLQLRLATAVQDDTESTLDVFRALLVGWCVVSDPPPGVVESVVDCAHALYDTGYWLELGSVVDNLSFDADDNPVEVAMRYFGALVARRTVGVREALRRLEHLEPDADALGERRQSFDLDVAYITEISGNYAKARQDFKDLYERLGPFDPTSRLHRRVHLYHGDMLTMDGDFPQASMVLLEAAERLGAEMVAPWIEFVRHRAHVFRFSFLLDDAELLYTRALRAADDMPAMQAKLRTNLGETLCWNNPREALVELDIAEQQHQRLGNRIELAKCGAARSIAQAKLGEFASAEAVAERAGRTAESIGYPAGVAFGVQALVHAHALGGRPSEALAQHRRLSSVVRSLGTYEHLCVSTSNLVGIPDDRSIGSSRTPRWIEPETLDERLDELLRR